MNKVILFSLIQVFCFTAGFAQNPPWAKTGERIPARADLDVRWAATNRFPQRVWTYQLLPNDFSPQVISNVMTLCSFTEKDKVEENTNGITFQNPDGSRKLSISFPAGRIHYKTTEPDYSPTNLAVGVPSLSQLPELATNVLRRLHIRFSNITGYFDTNKIEYMDPVLTIYYIGNTDITNIAYRAVLFRRKVDDIPIAREFYGFNVGEHGKICLLSITWPNLKRIKLYRTVSQNEVVDFLRKGNAVHGPFSDNAPYVDWPSIKSVTITRAMPSYLIGNSQLYPFLALDAIIDTGHGDTEVAIDCPIIDESKL